MNAVMEAQVVERQDCYTSSLAAANTNTALDASRRWYGVIVAPDSVATYRSRP
jgi:hypothetical protein